MRAATLTLLTAIACTPQRPATHAERIERLCLDTLLTAPPGELEGGAEEFCREVLDNEGKAH